VLFRSGNSTALVGAVGRDTMNNSTVLLEEETHESGHCGSPGLATDYLDPISVAVLTLPHFAIVNTIGEFFRTT